MIKFSAEDIVNQTFETSFRGYDRQQVEEFLEVLGREWTHLVGELKQARAELEEHRKELQEYRNREKSLHDALNMAKEMSDEIKRQAEREAELKVADAEVKAEKMLAGVESRMQDMRDELRDLQQQRVRYESEMRSILESHMKMLDLMSEPEAVPESSISRSPKPAPDPPGAEEDAVAVSEDDIESSEPVEDEEQEDSFETSPGVRASHQ